MKTRTEKSKITAVALAAVLCFGAVFFGVRMMKNRSPQLPSAEISAQIAPLNVITAEPEEESSQTDSSSMDECSQPSQESSQSDVSSESSQKDSSYDSSSVESPSSQASSVTSSREENSAKAQNDSSKAPETSRTETYSTSGENPAGESSAAHTETSSAPEASSASEKITAVTPEPAPDGKKINKQYFTTTIKNGETVTEEAYFFEVTHLDKSLKLRSCEVSVNGGEPALFAGRCTLTSGKNTIRVTCTYTDSKNSVVRAFKDYNVFLKSEKPAIETDLKNCTVHESRFTFTAEGKQGKNTLPVNVGINGVKLECDGKVTVTLSEGENVITLNCGETQRIFTVNYVPLPDPDILTDLADMTVYGKALSFTASCVGDDSAKFTVQVNGKTVREEDGRYSCTLNFGTNNIRLLMRGRITLEKNFTVTCLPEYNEAELPVLTNINISDGMEVTGNALSVRLTAQDYLANRIYSGKLILSVNGSPVTRAWEDGRETGYELTLASGENTVTVSLTDADGRQREYRYLITSKDADANTETGRISITVNADMVGLGTICSDPSFPVLSGETGFDTVERFLRDNGFEVYYRGSDSSRYLSGIGMGGRFAAASPADRARAYLEEKGISYTEDHDPNVLGEFNFTSGSGWIYKRNGQVPGYALTATVLGGGESIELFYSLDYGNDIRSFYP